MIGEGFAWHDDIAQNLGGYEPGPAVRLSTTLPMPAHSLDAYLLSVKACALSPTHFVKGCALSSPAAPSAQTRGISETYMQSRGRDVYNVVRVFVCVGAYLWVAVQCAQGPRGTTREGAYPVPTRQGHVRTHSHIFTHIVFLISYIYTYIHDIYLYMYQYIHIHSADSACSLPHWTPSLPSVDMTPQSRALAQPPQLSCLSCVLRLENGYTEVSVPLIVSRSTLTGTGQLPKFEMDLFAVNHKVGAAHTHQQRHQRETSERESWMIRQEGSMMTRQEARP